MLISTNETSNEELIRLYYGVIDEPSMVDMDDYIEEEEVEICQLLKS